MARDILREFELENVDLEPRAETKPTERLSRWLVGSLVFHALLILGLFFSPLTPEPGTRKFPVYSVDLIGGEKLGGGTPGIDLSPAPAPKRMAPRRDADAVKPEAKPKAVAKIEPAKAEKPIKEQVAKVEKRKTVDAEPVARDAVALKVTKAKEPAAKESAREAKAEAGAESGALDNVRERIMQAAVERAKSRNESTQRSSKGDGGSGGPGEGEGAAALGKGGRGGGTVRGMEYLIYQNRMFETIKGNWAWAGRGNLKVEVHFSVKESGEITGLRVVQSSGDASYDESVLRALKKSSPLPPPPENHRRDFAHVELTFRPQDLGA